MAKARYRKPASNTVGGEAPGNSVSKEADSQALAAAELLSFLRESGTRAWTEKDLSSALRVSMPRANEATAVLQLQGYIEAVGDTGQWRASEQGDLVSGAKPPRFTPKSIRDALDALRDRIQTVNDDPGAAYKITDAVAFGDFLSDRPRVQAAQVGVRLASRSEEMVAASPRHQAAALEFLKQLRGKTALLQVVPYEDWMGSRSHVRLL